MRPTRATIITMQAPMKVTLTEEPPAGTYVVAEQREDGSLVASSSLQSDRPSYPSAGTGSRRLRLAQRGHEVEFCR